MGVFDRFCAFDSLGTSPYDCSSQYFSVYRGFSKPWLGNCDQAEIELESILAQFMPHFGAIMGVGALVLHF